MNSKTSTLNPYAESYVPLSKKETKKEEGDHKKIPSGEGNVSGDSNPADDSKLKSQQVCSLAPTCQNSDQMESEFADEDSEMDLAYLQMIFPGICNQSLVDVYTVNRGDLEAAIDMLNHLESVGKLPGALDIEVAAKPTPTPSGDCSSVKGLNPAALQVHPI